MGREHGNVMCMSAMMRMEVCVGVVSTNIVCVYTIGNVPCITMYYDYVLCTMYYVPVCRVFFELSSVN